MNTLAKPDTNLLGLTRIELEQFALERGQPRYRGAQIYRAMYARRERDFAAITDLSREFRTRLASEYRVAYPSIERAVESRDGAGADLSFQVCAHSAGQTDGKTAESLRRETLRYLSCASAAQQRFTCAGTPSPGRGCRDGLSPQ